MLCPEGYTNVCMLIFALGVILGAVCAGILGILFYKAFKKKVKPELKVKLEEQAKQD